MLAVRECKINRVGMGKVREFFPFLVLREDRGAYVDDRVVGHPGGLLGRFRLQPGTIKDLSKSFRCLDGVTGIVPGKLV